MKMSKLFVQTLREFPADAEVVSHKFLVRAGYIRKLTSGVYSYLPLMWRVIHKIENIIREELDKSGAQELLLPVVQPRELWDESGRWEAYGKELARFRDRHDREMCLSPTAEEVITAVAREGLKSYKQLPVNLYQFQEKFRDEVRPRFGLLRGREFIMKDGYSLIMLHPYVHILKNGKEGEKIFQIFSFSPMMILHILSNIKMICLPKTRNDSFLNIASHSQTDTVFSMKFFQLLNRFFCIIHHRKKVHVFRRNHSISQERVPEPVKQWSPKRLPNENQRNWIDFSCLNQSQDF